MPPALSILVPLLLLVPPGQEVDVVARLKAARVLLGSAAEGDFRRGVQLCAELDSEDSMELLLSVLDEEKSRRSLPVAHYRDTAWEGAIEFGSDEGRARVAEELRKNRKNEWCRAWCAELLGIYGDEVHGEALVRALKDRSVPVRRAAARALGRVGFGGAATELLEAAEHEDLYLRGHALEALARLDPDAHGALFHEHLARDEDGGVRCLLLGVVPELYPDAVVARAHEALADEDWRPRMQAVENLEQVRTRESVDGLVRAANDVRPAVARRAFRALAVLTGLRFTKGEGWKEWWTRERETFAIPTEPFDPEGATEPGASVAEYHGIRVDSDRVAFLMDRSAAMREWLASKDSSKQDASVAELSRVFTQLRGDLVFNVYSYEQDFTVYSKKPIPFTEKAAKKALAFVAKQPIRAAKDVWQVLEAVVADPELDTVYLLSSGEPEVGLYVHHNRITSNLIALNRFHKVVVHTVAFTSSEWYRDQLVKISEATGGEFRWLK